MSASITSATLRSIRLPITNIGIMTSMPISIDQLSAIQPITGSTNSPGITHSDPIAKPVARARGGMASERAASTPGPMIANDAEITQLSATATYDVRGEREPGGRNGRQHRHRRDEPDQTLDVAGEASGCDAGADHQTDERERFGDGRCDAAGALVEAELLLVQQARRA